MCWKQQQWLCFAYRLCLTHIVYWISPKWSRPFGVHETTKAKQSINYDVSFICFDFIFRTSCSRIVCCRCESKRLWTTPSPSISRCPLPIVSRIRIEYSGGVLRCGDNRNTHNFRAEFLFCKHCDSFPFSTAPSQSPSYGQARALAPHTN